MGMSIYMHRMDLTAVVSELRDQAPDRDVQESFVHGVMSRFGVEIAPGEFIVMYNEYYSDTGYNPSNEIEYFFGAYYGIEYCELPYKGLYDYSGVNAREVWESMFPDEEYPETEEDYY